MLEPETENNVLQDEQQNTQDIESGDTISQDDSQEVQEVAQEDPEGHEAHDGP